MAISDICFSLLIAPFLTPISLIGAILMGGLISIGGFFGDVTFSAIKRMLTSKTLEAFCLVMGGFWIE